MSSLGGGDGRGYIPQRLKYTQRPVGVAAESEYERCRMESGIDGNGVETGHLGRHSLPVTLPSPVPNVVIIT